jgi:protein-tyrosine phosphatase
LLSSYTPRIEILVLCTANVCRSPMAESMLRARLAVRGIDAEVTSAGFLVAGRPVADEVESVLAERGLEPSKPHSASLDELDPRQFDLILCMTRAHVRELAVRVPDQLTRTFTVKELVRRGREIGPRSSDESVEAWLERARADRTPSMHLGDSPEDDVADPVGSPVKVFRATADELDALLAGVVDLVWPPEPIRG